MEFLWQDTVDPQKVAIGVGFYSPSFILSDLSCNLADHAFPAGGDAGPRWAIAGPLICFSSNTG